VSRIDFLRGRRTGIGGSDCGPIVGLPGFRTRVGIYLSKVATDSPDDEPTERTYWGHALEPVIANRFAEEHGIDIVRSPPLARHPEHEWMVGNLDAIIPGEKPGVLEVKNVDKHMARLWGDENSDDVPLIYVAQCAWYMAVKGYSYARLAALFGGNDYREYHIERDFELEALLISRCRDFWFNHVLAAIFPVDDGGKIELDQRIYTVVANLKAANVRAEVIASEIQGYEVAIKCYMGERATLTHRGRPVATWKSGKVARFDVEGFRRSHADLSLQFTKSTNSRVFRLK
jgi:putative phage-type endonuclease